MPFVQSSPEGNLGQFPWPHFQGAGDAVAHLANAIAAQRYKQTQDTQKTVADSIQEMQAQGAANAALDQAGAMGLADPGALKGQGISGLGAYTELAKLIDFQKKEAERERLNNSLIDWRAGGGAGGPGRGNKVQDPDTGEWMTSTQLYNRRKSQADVLGTQAEAIQGEGVTKPMAHGYVMKDGKMAYASTPEEQANPELVSPGDPLDTTTTPVDPKAAYPPTFTPQYVQSQTAARQKLLDRQQAIQKQMLNTPPDAGQGGGTPALSPQDQQALDWANANPNDPRAAKIQARLGYGG